jgi:PadR family transcriptional regulator, regulatory protein PadR
MRSAPAKQKWHVQQGTLALMALKTLQVLGPLHGYGIARRIAQISDQLLSVNQGTLYPVLLRLEQEGALSSRKGDDHKTPTDSAELTRSHHIRATHSSTGRI